ncbi:hypothetical protein KW791_02080 [Candidatus Parcubacteria bacterium]|nr:hypothetical protein [Candidatus Parcubacteria bacterium]
MKHSKKLLIAVLFGLLIVSGNVLADVAPDLPECARGIYYSLPVTCGYAYLNLHILLGRYQDQFVLIKKTSDHHGCWDDYKLASEADVLTNVSVIAVDHKYFDQQGGISGIFKTELTGTDECGDSTTMEPKNSEDLLAHSYKLIVSSNDPLVSLNIFYQESGKPTEFVPWYPYVEVSDLSCAGMCKEDVIYVPQSISGHNIMLTQGKITYTPNTIGQSVTYPAYKEAQVKTHWWQRFWTSFKQVFFSI